MLQEGGESEEGRKELLGFVKVIITRISASSMASATKGIDSARSTSHSSWRLLWFG